MTAALGNLNIAEYSAKLINQPGESLKQRGKPSKEHLTELVYRINI